MGIGHAASMRQMACDEGGVWLVQSGASFSEVRVGAKADPNTRGAALT